MFKRFIVLLLALLVSIAVIACTKKVDTEVASSSTPSSSTPSRGPAAPGDKYDDADDMTSSEFEKIESETMTDSNVSISFGSSDESSSSDGGSSNSSVSSNPSGNTSSTVSTGSSSVSSNTAFY